MMNVYFQTLYLASALIKFLWQSATSRTVRPGTINHHGDLDYCLHPIAMHGMINVVSGAGECMKH